MSGTSHLQDFHDTIHGDSQDFSYTQSLAGCFVGKKKKLGQEENPTTHPIRQPLGNMPSDVRSV